MRLVDLRCEKLSLEKYDHILSPAHARRLLSQEFVLVHAPANNFFPVPGYQLRSRTGFCSHNQPSADITPLLKLIDTGEVVVVDEHGSWNRSLHPFFIAGDGHLVHAGVADSAHFFGSTVLQHYQNELSMCSAKPRPTQTGDSAPTTDKYGPGHWVTRDNDYKAAKNAAMMLINRLTSMGDEGRVFGSEGKDYQHTARDKIQVWQPLPPGTRDDIRRRSVIRRYGQERIIQQRYLEGDDPWQSGGKSWHWQPVQADDEYEFQE
ncbi:hypothetical protein FJU30_16750 [Affinibrenneria salicis]|uniref:DUF8093 domain-containing protein n=1 Tax=Affinibrenneria salicis TaxID=2590031 RepID=A0A5J5FW70_9GAMM|nr:hypothetical protein [Affinibrenneria salicis]KAA8998068.1 hypothetical protein FJU30_16750 [Affinibrenneria salicis]